MQSRVSLFTLITFISCASCAVPFYKYGSGAGDSRLPTGANPSVGFTLPESYTFYGVEYSRIFISDNGYVTLGRSVLTTRPVPFPISSGSYQSRRSPMIAPYWSDVDTRCAGEIFYRQVQLEPDNELTLKIQQDVAQSGNAFTPTSAVVVTWEKIRTPPNCKVSSTQPNPPTNSFQFVLTTDGIKTFALFRYKMLEWHTSNFGRGPASAGENAGDFSNGFNLINNPEEILSLVSMTNVQEPGLFVRQIDLEPSRRVQTILMGNMMALAAAEAMEFDVAEAELDSVHDDIPDSEFNREEQTHHEEYVGGLTDTTKNVEFYPFDTPDVSSLGESDEATSGKEYLKIPIYFFGKNYSYIIVNSNGFLTLEDGYDFPAYAPRVLKTTNVPTIAPFFADVDTRGSNSGKIYYRQTDDGSLLSRAKQDIEYAYGVSFTPLQLYIVTWDKVGFYNRHDDLLNSFQVIIATDSHTTYVIFIYQQIEWTSPDSTSVTVGAGLGAKPSLLPVMGISDGKTIERLVKASEEPRDENEILSVVTDAGNTRVPGMWIFEASAAAPPSARFNVHSSDKVDPKIRYSEYQRASRPYVSVDRKMKSDVDSLVSELQNAR